MVFGDVSSRSLYAAGKTLSRSTTTTYAYSVTCSLFVILSNLFLFPLQLTRVSRLRCVLLVVIPMIVALVDNIDNDIIPTLDPSTFAMMRSRLVDYPPSNVFRTERIYCDHRLGVGPMGCLMALKNPISVALIVLGLASAFAIFADRTPTVTCAGDGMTEIL